jgi:GntR family transcriptional regulator/MocR family aminotransferase
LHFIIESAIVEDDHDYSFHDANNSIFPLASTCPSDRVIYIGSLSKIFAPAFHIGYVVASPDFITLCAREALMIDRLGSSTIELAVSELMHSGEVKRQLLKMTKVYDERRNALLDQIEEKLSDWVDATPPNGGLAFWLRFRKSLNMAHLTERAAKANIRFSSGSVFTESNKPINAIRLGFAGLNIKELSDGVSRLQEIFSNFL